MTDLRKAAEMALEALEKYEDEWLDDGRRIYVDAELDALRQALAQPEQEPEIVQRVRRYAGKRREAVGSPHINAKECIALANWIESMFAQPEREWVGLTDDEINKIVDLNTSDDGGFDIWCDGIAVARIVCAKLKEKNA